MFPFDDVNLRFHQVVMLELSCPLHLDWRIGSATKMTIKCAPEYTFEYKSRDSQIFQERR